MKINGQWKERGQLDLPGSLIPWYERKRQARRTWYSCSLNLARALTPDAYLALYPVRIADLPQALENIIQLVGLDVLDVLLDATVRSVELSVDHAVRDPEEAFRLVKLRRLARGYYRYDTLYPTSAYYRRKGHLHDIGERSPAIQYLPREKYLRDPWSWLRTQYLLRQELDLGREQVRHHLKKSGSGLRPTFRNVLIHLDTLAAFASDIYVPTYKLGVIQEPRIDADALAALGAYLDRIPDPDDRHVQQPVPDRCYPWEPKPLSDWVE